MIRVFAPGAAPPSVTLTPDESHHLVRVLRARPGDAVIVFDGRGAEWEGRLAPAAGRGASATIDALAPRTPRAEPAVAVVLGIALLKGDQMDQVVRDATMLGVAAIQPVITSHVALPERARTSRNVDRWMRVAVASAKQSGRATVPDVREPVRLETLLDAPGCDAIVICVEPGHGGGAVAGLARPRSALVLVGPEGGWADDERARAASAGAVPIELGPRTLRAETAPVVALSALWTVWGWQ